MVKRRDKTFQIRVDEDTLEGAHQYAEQKGVSLAAIVRAFLRLLSQDPPADLDGFIPVDEETEVAPYRPRKRRKRRR